MATAVLDQRQDELARAFVSASEQSGRVPFDFVSGQRFSHPGWPTHVQPPDREERRRLLHLGYLEVDRAFAPGWRFYPSQTALMEFGGDAERDLVAAMNDPDQRLGVILESTVKAFEADPNESIQLRPLGSGYLARHPHWPLPPDVARLHDVRQLEELGLVMVIPQQRGITFCPTIDGRMAVHNGPELLERRGEGAASEHEANRLRRLAQSLRTGDVAVGVLAGTATAVIRGLIGL
jgi:hypothetical protein